MPQHTGRRQSDVLLLQSFGNDLGLRVQFTLEDQAVVDHGGDAIEQFAMHSKIAGLCLSDPGQHTG